MKVATRLVLTFSIVTAVALFLLSAIGYQYTSRQLTESIQNEMKEIVNTHVSTLDVRLDNKVKILQSKGNMVAKKGSRLNQLTDEDFGEFSSADEDLANLYFASIHGKTFDGSGWKPYAGFDPRTRPWYVAAVKADDLVLTDPYIDVVTKKMTMTFAFPVKDSSGKLLGVIGEDILLDTIKDTIQKINIRGQGHAILLDKGGHMLVHPDPELVMKNVKEVEKLQEIQGLLEKMLAGSSGFAQYEYQGVQKNLFYQKIPATGWTLAVAIPIEAIYQPLEILKQRFIVTTLVILVLVILICLVVSNAITRPLLQLTMAAQQIAAGNLHVQAAVGCNQELAKNEIVQLGREFNHMASQLEAMIKERDLALAEAEAARGHLEEKVENRTQELTATNQELQAMNEEVLDTLERLKKAQQQLVRSEKMAALGGLVSGMAHEINTPIGVAVTAASHLAELNKVFSNTYGKGPLRRRDLDLFITETREASNMVLANLKRAAQLIGSFKTVSVDQACEEGRSFLLKEYLADILVSLQPKLRKTEHKVTLECDETLKIRSYPGAIAQIVTNLLVNSLMHGYREGETGNIVIAAKLHDTSLELSYQDDGRGMEEAVLQKVFDPFFTTARGAGGTGLGLYLVYHIVTHQFNGTIECISQPGKGSRFVIWLPGEARPEGELCYPVALIK